MPAMAMRSLAFSALVFPLMVGAAAAADRESLRIHGPDGRVLVEETARLP